MIKEEINGQPKMLFSGWILFLMWFGSIFLPIGFSLLLRYAIVDPVVDLFIEKNDWILLLLQTLGFVIIFLSLYFMVKKKKGSLLDILNLNTTKRVNIKFLLIGLGWGLFFILSREMIAFSFRFVSIYYESTGLFLPILYGFLSALILSVFEELFYRGFLQTQLSYRLPQSLSILLLAFLSYLGKTNYMWKWEIFAILSSTIVYGYLYATTKNIYLSIGWHFANLFIATIAADLFNYTYYETSYVFMLQVVINVLSVIGIFGFSLYQTRKHR